MPLGEAQLVPDRDVRAGPMGCVDVDGDGDDDGDDDGYGDERVGLFTARRGSESLCEDR